MRVLTFLHSFELGGVERVALRLCQAWQAAGVDVRLVMGQDHGPLRRDADGLDYGQLSAGRSAAGSWKTLRMIAKLPAVIRRTQPDVLFCAGNTYAVVAVAMKLILGRACPPIVAKISNDLARRDMGHALRRFYYIWLRIQGRFIDRFVGMAPPMRAEIAHAMRIDPAAITIIDDPALTLADIERLSQRRREPPVRHRFVAAGRLVPQKNFALLLDAFAQIAKSDDRLTILGDGALRGTLEQRAVRLGIADRVAFAGHVADLGPWFADSDIYVLSSDYEGVPAVIAEALAAGLAIVATDCSVSMNDMLGGGVLGILVPPGARDGLAAAMDTARTVPVDRAAMRTQATRFTVEAAAQRYRDLFDAMRPANARLRTGEMVAMGTTGPVEPHSTGALHE